jgi:phosphonate transport system ATP-binding protein
MRVQPVLFELSNACVTYGQRRVLDEVSLTLRAGEKVALVGPSGAGKSTLLNELYRQQTEQIALCPQSHGLVDLLSCYQNMFMGGLDRFSTLASLWNLLRPLASARTEIQQLAEDLGLSEQLWQSVDRLSGGQRQRVAIGRALYRQQPIFFGDEPVSSLDPVQAEQLLTILLQRHPTAVVSLHNRQLALNHFDRVIALAHGKIIHDCASRDLSPQDLDALYGKTSATGHSKLSAAAASQPLNSGPAACVTGRIIR